MYKKYERLHYQRNNFSYWFCLLAILFDVLYMCGVIAPLQIVPDINIGLDVVFNILFLLFVFLGSEKLKTYNKNWGYYIIGIAIVQIIRIFYIPNLFFFTEEIDGVIVVAANSLTATEYSLVVGYLIASSVCLIVAAVVSMIKTSHLALYFEEKKKLEEVK